jgi:hypothetical protein
MHMVWNSMMEGCWRPVRCPCPPRVRPAATGTRRRIRRLLVPGSRSRAHPWARHQPRRARPVRHAGSPLPLLPTCRRDRARDSEFGYCAPTITCVRVNRVVVSRGRQAAGVSVCIGPCLLLALLVLEEPSQTRRQFWIGMVRNRPNYLD